MRDVNLDQMSNQYFDVLKEIGNIGAGNAMTALSQMLQCKVDMKVPQVRLLEFSEVGALMGGEEQIMAAVLLGVEGDITGYMMFMAEEQGARHLIGKITGGMLPEGSEFEEMGMSALQEVGPGQYHHRRLSEFPVFHDWAENHPFSAGDGGGHGGGYPERAGDSVRHIRRQNSVDTVTVLRQSADGRVFHSDSGSGIFWEDADGFGDAGDDVVRFIVESKNNG